MVAVAALVWKWPNQLIARNELIFSLLSGACYFFAKGSEKNIPLLLVISSLGPVTLNRAVRKSLQIKPMKKALEFSLIIGLIVTSMFGFVIYEQMKMRQIFDLIVFFFFLDLLLQITKKFFFDKSESGAGPKVIVLSVAVLLSIGISISAIAGYPKTASAIGSIAAVLVCYWLLFVLQEFELTGVNILGIAVKPLNAGENAILMRLRELMENEKVFLHSDINMFRLSKIMNVPQHKLSRIIRLGEGVESFNKYINHQRINWCKSQFENLENYRSNILEIAFAAGYNSLSSFNRAFKSELGETPTEYRSKLIIDQAANPSAINANAAEIPNGT